MPSGTLEHVNVTVSDPDRTAALLQRICGWKERWRGPSQLGGRTIHVGSDANYIALWTDGKGPRHFAKGVPMNHVGLVVDDLDAVETIVIEAGLEPFSHGDYEPGRRFYFFDWDHIEWEVVTYA